MGLEAEIAAWDRKSADHIRAVFARQASDESFLARIVGLLAEEPLQSVGEPYPRVCAASWKKIVEFLGFEPRKKPKSPPERLIAFRRV